MSDFVPEVECSLCGREGGSFVGCGTCHGRAKDQPAAFTLSDHRARRAPREDRYGGDGGLNPRSPNLPGSAQSPYGGRQ